MSFVRDISAQRTIQGVSVRDSGGVLRVCRSAYVRDAVGVLRVILQSGNATASPPSASGYANSKSAVRIYTSSVTISLTGISSPYSILWNVSGSGWEATNPSGISTAFRSPSLSAGDESEASAYASITDAGGNVFNTNTVVIIASNIGSM